MDDPKITSSDLSVDAPRSDAADSPHQQLELMPDGTVSLSSDSVATAASAPPLADALPGDAAPTPLIPLEEPQGRPRVTIIRPPAPDETPRGPRSGSFALWALIWVAAWAGCMSLTLNHRFDRRFDWNTSYFSIVARNLVDDGFAKHYGGMYLTAGEIRDDFYAGHPPLTAWLLAGWMKLFAARGQSDAVIRALPLTFTAINLLLLFALVKRTFGAPAGLAATVICSLLPMTAYYAQVVNMEPFVLTFILGASLGYLSWCKRGSSISFFILCVCVILGCWTDWPMYIFTGFLAIGHFFRRRDWTAPEPPSRVLGNAEVVEETPPGPPVLSSLFLLVLPMAVFAVFLVYLKLNGSKPSELTDRARDRMSGGLHMLLERIKHPKDFINLFTPSALFLAAFGVVFWMHWSRRLSLAGGEVGRRAAFRILLCIGLMQLVYTLVFPEGASVHEFWQYYLIVPVSVLAAAFCTWLTVAGGTGRRFSLGVFDRAGWAMAASIPFFAPGPVGYRMQISILGREVESGDNRLDDDYAGALARNTQPSDIILTDWMQEHEDFKPDAKSSPTSRKGLGYALPWYTNRTMFPYEGTDKDDRDTRSIEGIKKICADDKYKGRRVLYLWSGDGSSALEEQLNLGYPRQFEFGKAVVYLIQGEPDPKWKKAGIEIDQSAVTPVAPPVVPIAIKPTTTQTTAVPASTKPASTKPAP